MEGFEVKRHFVGAMKILVGGLEKSENKVECLMALSPRKGKIALLSVEGIETARIIHRKAMCSRVKVPICELVVHVGVWVIILNNIVAIRVVWAEVGEILLVIVKGKFGSNL